MPAPALRRSGTAGISDRTNSLQRISTGLIIEAHDVVDLHKEHRPVYWGRRFQNNDEKTGHVFISKFDSVMM